MKLNPIIYTGLVSFVVAELSFASSVDAKFNYQDYLDFGNNRGQFTPKNENVTITSRDKETQIHLNAPMIDFSAANLEGKWKSEFTNIGLGYTVSAAHMIENIERKDLVTRHTVLNFGGVESIVVATDNKFESWSTYEKGGGIDFVTTKMSKFNLNVGAEISPHLNFVSLADEKEKKDASRYRDNFRDTCSVDKSNCDYTAGKGQLANSNRYTYFVREGTGVQKIGPKNSLKTAIKIEDHDTYHTGGFNYLDKNELNNRRFTLEFRNSANTANGWQRLDFSSSSAPGDSGSAIYVYDNVDKAWYIVGVVSKSNCITQESDYHLCTDAYYSMINEAKIKDFKDAHTVTLEAGDYTINDNGLKKDNKDMGAHIIKDTNAKGHITFSDYRYQTNFNNRNNLLENSKDLYLKGRGKITLDSDIDLGAGGLITDKDSAWSVGSKNSTTYYLITAGIFTDTGSKVTYNVTTLKNDFLHKTGSGELEITTSSPEAGLRIGDGTVTLKNNTNALSFKEIYFTSGRGTLKIDKASNVNTDYIYFGSRGGTLDLNGQSLNFKKIYASDSGAILTNTSNAISTLTFENTDNYLYHGQINSVNGGININFDGKNNHKNIAFDGGMDNQQGTLDIKNGNLTLQGKPVTHAYLNPSTMHNAIYHLQNHRHKILTTPTSATQEDWLIREYKLKELNINNSTLTLSHNATLETQKLSATKSTINLGSSNVWIDKQDGENVKSEVLSGNLNTTRYGDATSYGVGKDMIFKQELTQGQSNTIENVKFIGNLDLKTNSTANLSHMEFTGNIDADSTSTTNISQTTLKGNINTKHTLNINNLSKIQGNIDAINLNINNSITHGNVKIHNLDATNATFIVDVNFEEEKAKNTITSTVSTKGFNNTILINPITAPKEVLNTPITLATLKNTNSTINKDYFNVANFNYGFSTYVPNVTFENSSDNAIWKLEKVALKQSLFNSEENKKITQKSDGMINQILLSYVIEWNNMQKRMGELRDNPNNNGIWIRSFGGGGSDRDYQGNFFELQLGSDIQTQFSGGSIYFGGMFNYTKNTLNGNQFNSYSDGFGLGSYASVIFDNGFYLDGILRYIYRINTFNIDFIPGQSLKNKKSSSNNLIFSIEGGYRYLFKNNFFIQPEIELIAGYIGSFNIQNNNISLEMKNAAPVSNKLAFFFGRQINAKNPSSLLDSLGFRSGIGYAYDLTEYGDKIFADLISESHHYKGIKDKRMFINLSVNYALGTRHRLNFEFERSFFGILNINWLVNATYRFSF